MWERLRTRRVEYSDNDFIAYLDLIPALGQAVRLPPMQAIPEVSRLFDLYHTNTTSEIASAVHPSWTKALSRHYEIEAKLTVTKHALALERFRLANRGQLPRPTEAMVPEFLRSRPHDLLDGKPLRFKALTNGFVVYSIGADGVDDGGSEKTGKTTQTNYDVTFTIER